jgi:DNA-binding transcriptional ArsR family regulator
MPSGAHVLLRPLRARILEELSAPQSAASVAKRLSLPRQNVTYHLRELEKEGLVELVEERKVGNCVERIIRATARAYLVSAQALGSLAEGAASAQDRFSAAYLLAVSAQAVREVATLRQRADEAGKNLATLTLQTEVRFASAGDRAAFARELADAVAKLVAKYHDKRATSGRTYRVAALAYPKPKDADEDEREEHRT